MKKVLFIFLLLLTCNLVEAQEAEIGMYISTRNDDTGKNLPGSTIEIYQDGKLIKTLTADSKGRVPVQVFPVNHLYVIKYKKPGFVTKIANVDARFDTPEDLEAYTQIQLEAGLFAKVEGFDFSFLEKQPMITWEFSPEGYMAFDQVALKKKLKRIDELKKEMESKKEELEKQEKERQKQEEDFNAYVKAGDNASNKTDYQTAIEQYQFALKIKEDAPVRSRLENAKKLLADQQNKEKNDKDFADKMQAAKTALSSEKYEDAIRLYQEASKIKPNEQLPKDQIAAIQKIINDKKAEIDKFNKLVADGDAAVTAKTYDAAITKFTSALAIKDDANVRSKLENAKKLKLDAENAAKANQANEEKYNTLITEANKLFDSETYTAALAKYKEALLVKPGESHPTNRITEINKKLTDLKAKEEAEKKKEADYLKLINEANTLFDTGKLNEAKTKYKAALVIKPGEAVPTNKIDQINKMLADQESETKKNAEYTAALNKANELFNQKKYTEAKSQYNLALGVKPNELEPKQQIKKIDDILAQQKAEAENEKAYQDFMTEGNGLLGNNDLLTALDRYKKALNAKPGDVAAKTKIDEVNKKIKENSENAAQEKEFQKFLDEGNKLFSNKDYQTAKLNYQKAYAIKKDPVVDEKIKHMDKLIADTQSAAEIDTKFDKAIKEADALYTANNYKAALTKYQEAKSIKESQHADDRIADIQKKLNAENAAKEEAEKILALNTEAAKYYADNKLQLALEKYKESYAIKPDPEINKKVIEIQNRITEENKSKSTDQAYQDKIDLADAKFNEGDWEQAIGYYNQAKQVKSGETYPDTQIVLCQKKMQDESANEAEKSYQKIVAKADEYFKTKNYDEAISYYKRALGIKKDDPYPKAQLVAIQKIRDDAASQSNEQDKLDQQFNDLVKSADVLFTAKNYTDALSKYKEALQLRPTDSHVLAQIKLVNDELNKKDEVDLETEKYNKLISEADNLMQPGSWADAKAKYEAARLIKPNETYPINQIVICNNQMSAESSSEEEKNYQKILTVAQKKMDAGDYEKSLELFTRANGIRPSDALPIRKIQEINQILANNKNKAAYQDLINKGDAHFEKQEWKAALPFYEKAYALNNDKYPDDQIKKIRAQTREFDKKQYDKMIVKADEYFRAENYEKAKGLYLRAIRFQPSWDNTYPKDQLNKIKTILNPPQATNNGVRNAGDKVIGKSEQDMAALFADGEEQREYDNSHKVVTQNEEHTNYKNNWAENEKKATNSAKDLTDEIVVDLNEQGTEAEVQRKKAELATQNQADTYNNVQNEIAVYNEHVMYRQKDVVTNLETEINENKKNADIPRQEFEGDVVGIKTNVDAQNDLNANSQTNEIYDNKEYVNHVQETHVTQDPNMDVNRKNGEVKVVDMKVALVNEENKNGWAQEDAIMNTKTDVDLMVDEQIASRVNSDLVRQDMEDKVVEMESENTNYQSNLSRKQIDINYDVKGYADNVQEQIVIDNMANDIPRQKMEDEKTRIEDDVTEEQFENATNQELSINNTKNYVNAEVEKQNEIFSTKDDKRKDDAENVVTINTEITTQSNKLQAENQDNSFTTVDYVDKSIKETADQNSANQQKTIDNQDKTVETVNDLNDKKAQNAEENQQKVESTSDYITNLKDIDPKKVDVNVKNALGEKYPEGMTQEIYEIKDDNGRIVEYTIRRLVVTGGEGNIYEKTQSRSGISYSLNGQAITEYKWQDDTTNANLVRN